MGRKIQPKLKNMSQDELEAWEEKLAEMEHKYNQKAMAKNLKNGRGWIF